MKKSVLIAAVVFGFGFTVQAQNQTGQTNDGNPHQETPNWLLPNRGDFLWDTQKPTRPVDELRKEQPAQLKSFPRPQRVNGLSKLILRQ